jgi:2-(1,2-epoxy-1,2-dihydrophenyl)acetyl-CoA isomerase
MSTVLYEKRSDGVGLITLNRPESLNAMSSDLMRDLGDYLQVAVDDPDVRCVALTGAGRAFCAGGDVKRMNARSQSDDSSGGDTESLETSANAVRQAQDRSSGLLHSMAKPTVALINGHAVGAGLSLALACDVRLASDAAKFGTAFRNVGLSGDFGGSYFLQRLVGAGRARELYFTGEIIDAERALTLGMINRVLAADALMTEGLAFCAMLASGPSRALGRMKSNLNLAERASLQEVMDQEALNMRFSGQDADHREAAQAFVEKRKPSFRGE